MTHDMNTGNKI